MFSTQTSSLFHALLSKIAVLFPAFVIVFTIRGFAKALSAKLMGDDTAQNEGFLTLNPVAHLDFWGILITLIFIFIIGALLPEIFTSSFLIILLILLGVRWTIPAPIDEGRFKNYKAGVIVTTLSAPMGNFFLALIFLYLLKYFPFTLFPAYVFLTLVEMFNAIIELTIFFGVLDLLPIPPFDGGRLLQFILPESMHNAIEWLENNSIYILLILFCLPGVNNVFFGLVSLLGFLVKRGLLFLVF
jgi:Zn-dependent protease